MGYHDEKDCLSGSFLKYLEISAEYFNEEINRPRSDEDQNQYMLSGNVIHKYLLENDDFYNQYAIAPNVKPINQQQKTFCNLLIGGNDAEYAYKASYKTYDEKKCIALQEAMQPYIDAVIESKNKELVPEYLVQSAIKIDRKVELHKIASKLMIDNLKPENSETFNEREFHFEILNYKFKGKLDRLIIDHDNKLIKIVDLKTYTLRDRSEKRLDRIKRKFFTEKIYRQLYIYGEAVIKEYPGYNIEYWIVFASANFYNYIDVMKVDKSYIEDGAVEIEVLLASYEMNQENGFEYDSYYYDLGYIEMNKDDG